MKQLNYDFSVSTLASVKAPEGTDPDTLLEAAKTALLDKMGEVEMEFESTYDSETGVYVYPDGFESYPLTPEELWRAAVARGETLLGFAMWDAYDSKLKSIEAKIERLIGKHEEETE